MRNLVWGEDTGTCEGLGMGMGMGEATDAPPLSLGQGKGTQQEQEGTQQEQDTLEVWVYVEGLFIGTLCVQDEFID
jgi:hypothetical protein